MSTVGVFAAVGTVLGLLAVWFFAGSPFPEPTVRYPVDGTVFQDEFLETGSFSIAVPGKTIEIDGKLVSMTCVRGMNLQGEQCGWSEVEANGMETFHPSTTLDIIGSIVDVEDSYVEVMVGESGVYGIAKWGFWGDTTRAYRFNVEGGEYRAQLFQFVKKGYAQREPYEDWD